MIPNYLVYDSETTTTEKYGRKANPFLLENKLVAAGFKNTTVCRALYSSNVNEILGYIPSSIRILVGHNITFDLLYLWGAERMQYMLQEYNLKIWDTSKVEFILSAQQHKFPALRDIAVNKYSLPEREKKMEEYWKRGINTDAIPKELVLEDVLNDVLDTEQIFLKQYERCEKLKLLPLIETQMDMLLATIEMEYNGMYIDQQTFTDNKTALEKELVGHKAELDILIKKHW